MSDLKARRTKVVINTAIDVTSHELTCERVFDLAERKEPAYVCFATAHMLVEASRKSDINRAYRNASIVNPDGTPVAWCLKIMGHRDARCVNGPTCTPILLREAERRGTPVGFYGGRAETLIKMQEALREKYPLLKVNYICSPPFRALTEEEQKGYLAEIRASGAQLLFVGLGSPKQEIWMLQNYLSLNCVCLGVGAVFEFLSGEKVLPPTWIQRMGMTWLVRLCQEPRRLAVRNLYSPVFVLLFMCKWSAEIGRRMMGRSPHERPVEWGDAQ